jgi:hypothetical protein
MQTAGSNGVVNPAPAGSLLEAAGWLKISPHALKRRIAAGEIRAERIERPQGYSWAVYLDT